MSVCLRSFTLSESNFQNLTPFGSVSLTDNIKLIPPKSATLSAGYDTRDISNGFSFTFDLIGTVRRKTVWLE